jgi:hypothetical protein
MINNLKSLIGIVIFLVLGFKNDSQAQELNNKERHFLTKLEASLKNESRFKLMMDSIQTRFNPNELFLSQVYFIDSKFYYKTNKDSSKYYLQKAIAICERNKFDTLLIDLIVYKQNLIEDGLIPSDLFMADSLATRLNDKKRIAKVNQKLGEFFYFHKPSEAKIYYEKAYSNFMLVGDTINAGYCIQNIGFAYGEQLNDTNNCIKYMERALFLWEENRYLFQQGNISKYLGIMYSKQKNFKKAKSYIYRGVNKFLEAKDTAGIYVCYYDLGIIYENEHKLDSAIYFHLIAQKYWQTKMDTGRIFGINNNLLLDYMNTNNKTEAKNTYTKNDLLLSKGDDGISWILKLTFYKNCIRYFNSLNDIEDLALYNNRLTEYKNELISKGIKIPDSI